jgi:anti-sigma-K factor RskA
MYVLAGEYVLGALDAPEMRAVRRRADEDAALSTAIAEWEMRLMPLAAVVAPVVAPEGLWERIEQSIAPLRPVEAHPRVPPVLPIVVPPDRLGAPERPPMSPPIRLTRVWPWQVATGVSLAAAAAFAALAFLPRPLPTAPEQMAALMPSGGGAQPAYLVHAQPDGSAVITAMAPQPVPPGRDMELWMLPKGATVPMAAGVLPASGERMKLPAAPGPGTVLMISLEPAGGAPGGSPTGPVVYQGHFTQAL